VAKTWRILARPLISASSPLAARDYSTLSRSAVFFHFSFYNAALPTLGRPLTFFAIRPVQLIIIEISMTRLVCYPLLENSRPNAH
jgi:hypothetical protein